MHRFDRMHLSPEAALGRLDTVDLEEKSRLAEGIALIAVVDHRRDYLGAGYSCMRDYCTQHLRMSEDRALKRIQVARVALRFPQVFECLADGRLSVSTASVLAPHLDAAGAEGLLAAAANLSRPELLRLLAERSRPVARPVESEELSSAPEPADSHAPGHVNLHADPPAAPAVGEPTAPRSPLQATPARRGRVSVTSTGAHEVRLTLTDEEHADLCQATDLLGHAVPSGDPALVYARAMKLLVEHLRKRRFGAARREHVVASDAAVGPGVPNDGTVPSPAAELPAGRRPVAKERTPALRHRHIPSTIRREVSERDGHRCAFVSADGHRCGATRGLQFDHVVPLAQGGATTTDNLRLLCGPHNRYEAERVLGKDHVVRQRELAQRERARDRAAARAAKRRAAAVATSMAAARSSTPAVTDATCSLAGPDDDAATPEGVLAARHDDIVAALRGLGFQPAEARFGAGLADAMPEATLEACVRHALSALARPLVLRGERMARCSA